MTRAPVPLSNPRVSQYYTSASHTVPSRGIIYTPPGTTSSSTRTDHATFNSSRPPSRTSRLDLEYNSTQSQQRSPVVYIANNTTGAGPARPRVTMAPQPSTRMGPLPSTQSHLSQGYGACPPPDRRLEIRPAQPSQSHGAFPPPSRRPAPGQAQRQRNYHNGPHPQTHSRTPSPPFQMKQWLAEERQPVNSALSNFDRHFPSPTPPQPGPSTEMHGSAEKQKRYQDQDLSQMGQWT